MIRKIAIIGFMLAALTAIGVAAFRERLIVEINRDWYVLTGAFARIETMMLRRDCPHPDGPTTDIAAVLPNRVAEFTDFPDGPATLPRWGTMGEDSVKYLGADQEGAIFDPWGNAIWMQSDLERTSTVRFFSAGPNGRDDGEEGDDLVLRIDSITHRVEWPDPPATTVLTMLTAMKPPVLLAVVLLFAAYPALVVTCDRSPVGQWLRRMVLGVLACGFIATLLLLPMSYIRELWWELEEKGKYHGTAFVVSHGAFRFEEFYEWPIEQCAPHPPDVLVNYGFAPPVRERIDLLGFSFSSSASSHRCTSSRGRNVVLPMWMPALVLGVCPTVALIRGPLRRQRHRKRGLCPSCGYNLTGNTSGVCPECATGVGA